MASNRDSAVALPAVNTQRKIDFAQPLDLVVDTQVVKGKTAIVHDGEKGLGLGLATALAELGAHVAILGSDAKAGDAVVIDLKAREYSVSFFKTDTSDWNSLLSSFKQVITWSNDQLDIVITTAGIVTTNMLMSVLPRNHRPGADPPKPPTRVFETNLMGVYFTTSLAIWYFNKLELLRVDPEFKPQLLFICSMAGVRIDKTFSVGRNTLTVVCTSTKAWNSGQTMHLPNMVFGRSGRPLGTRGPAWLNINLTCLRRRM